MAGVYGVYLSVLRRLYLSGELILRFIGRSSFLSAFLVGRRANVFPRRTVFFTVLTVLLISLSRHSREERLNRQEILLMFRISRRRLFVVKLFFPPSIFAFLSRNIVSVRVLVLFETHFLNHLYNIII